jgi:predicted dehydrogenase
VAYLPPPAPALNNQHELMQVKIAVIGCGAVFEAFYLEALRKLQAEGRIQVALLVDSQQANLDRARSLFPGALTAADVSAIAAGTIERALVLTPPATHCAIMLALAAVGAHVYCEKPLAVAVDEAREIAATFNRKQLLCKVGYVRRLFPNLQVFRAAYRQLEAAPELSISDGEVFRWPIKTGSIFAPHTAGGGVIWDKLSHNLDVVQWIAGLRSVDRVHSSCRPGRVPTDILVEGATDRGRFRVAVSWTEGLGNLVRARSGDAIIESKNGLVPAIYASPASMAGAHAVGAASYGAAVEAALREFIELNGANAPSPLASADDSVALTGFLVDIDGTARKIAA